MKSNDAQSGGDPCVTLSFGCHRSPTATDALFQASGAVLPRNIWLRSAGDWYVSGTYTERAASRRNVTARRGGGPSRSSLALLVYCLYVRFLNSIR